MWPYGREFHQNYNLLQWPWPFTITNLWNVYFIKPNKLSWFCEANLAIKLIQITNFSIVVSVHFYCKWKKEWASSHTPRSNIAWECCIQRMAIPSISDGQSDRKPVSSELHKIILAKVQKGYKLLLKKDQISISCKNAYLQIMSFITTKFHKIMLSGFSGVLLTNCFE